MSGPPPLGSGAPAVERLGAFGRAPLFHVQMLVNEACPDVAASGTLALQLVAALEGPILLYPRSADGPEPVVGNLIDSWQVLAERVVVS